MTDRELFYRYLGLPSFSPMGLEVVNAEGIWLQSSDDRKYMDLVSGITVSNNGHRHPKVMKAMADQMEKYLHLNVYGEFIQSPQVQLARRLAGLLPDPLDSVYFVSSGSEAIEGAIKLAKRYTGRTGIASFKNAYHGGTHGCLSILGNETLKTAFRPLLPGVDQLGFNRLEDLGVITEQTACVVVELIQAEAGIVPATKEFVYALKRRCEETKTLIILDDVQMGMGRTGTMFSFEPYGLVPDILVLAKALGAGMPLGAFIASRPVMDTLAFNPELGHITTFGGHPLSCAAALAGLDVILEPGVLGQVESKGREAELLLTGHPALSGIRRRGLAMGLDLKDVCKKAAFAQAALAEDIILDWYLFRPATFRFAPPLIISSEEIVEACGRIRRALDTIS